MGHWLYIHVGINGTGPWYSFWSGFGSDLGEVAIIGGLIQIFRKHNCNVTHCWRIGKHPVGDGKFTVCRRHHPNVPDKVTSAHVQDAYDRTHSKGKT